MPELGKATYELVFNTGPYYKELDNVEVRTQEATSRIAKSIGVAEKELDTIGPTAEEMAAQTTAATSEAAGGFQKLGASATTAGDETAAAGEKAAAGGRAAAAGGKAAGAAGVSGWRKLGASMAATGRSAFKTAGLAGLGLAYFVVKDGYERLKADAAAWSQVQAGMQGTGKTAGVTGGALQRLAEYWARLDGVQKNVTYGIEALLLRFKLIRNEAGKNNDVFYRTVNVLENIAIGMKAAGRNVTPQQLSIMLGRALTDPAKGLNAMGRAGIKFSEGQQTVVKALIAAHKPLQAQEYILNALEKAWGKSGEMYAKTIPGKLDKAKEAFSDFSKTLLTAFLPYLTKLLSGLSSLLKWMQKNAGFVKVLIIGFVALKAAMVALGVAVQIFEVLTSPELLLVGAVLALVAAFVMAVRYPKMLEQGLEKLGFSANTAAKIVLDLRKAWAWMRTEAVKLWPSIRSVLMSIKDIVVSVIGFIRKHWDVFSYYLRTAWQYVVNTIKNDLDFLKSLFSFFADLIQGKWGKLWKDIEGMASAAWNQIVNIFWTYTKALLPVFQAIVNAFLWVVNQILKYAASAAESVVNSFANAYNWVSDNLGGVLGHIGTVTFNWGIGYVNLMGSIGKSAGGAFAAGLANGLSALQQVTIASGGTANVPVTYEPGKGWVTANGVPLSPSEQKQATQQWLQTHGGPFGKSKPSPGDTTTIGVSSGSSTTHVRVSVPHIPGGGGGPTYTPQNPSDFTTPTKGKKKKAKKGHKPTATELAFGPGWTNLEINLQKAMQRHSLSAELKALNAEETYLKHRIAMHKAHGAALLALQKALTAVDDKILSIKQKMVTDAQKEKLEELQIQLYKAQLIGNDSKSQAIQAKMDKIEASILASEEKEIRKQIAATEEALRKRIITKQQALDREAALYKKLLDIDKQRLALLKRTQAMRDATAKEMLQVLELRGSFFSEFAGNIFGGSSGNLTLTPNTGDNTTKNVEVNQHNTYNELPKNRHQEAQKMRSLTQGALAGP